MPGAPTAFETKNFQEKTSDVPIRWAINKNKIFTVLAFFLLFAVVAFYYLQKEAQTIFLSNSLKEFVGREEIFQQIKRGFQLRQKRRLSIVTLWGEGGIGKSEIANYYANKHLTHYSYVCWINAGSKEFYEQSYVHLAECLGLKIDHETPFAFLREKVHFALENKRFSKPWLMIFDNLEEAIPLPQRGKGNVLITSRKKGLNEAGTAIEIPVFSEEETRKLYKKILGGEKDEKWKSIGTILNFFPLAVNQTFHCMREVPNFVADSYFSNVGSNATTLLQSRYPETLNNVWGKNKLAILSTLPKAYEWLEICSYLHPDQIPISCLEYWLSQDKEGEGFETAKLQGNKILTFLVNYGLIHIDPGTQSFSIHPIKQQLIKQNQCVDDISKLKALCLLAGFIESCQCYESLNESVLDKQLLTQWEANAIWWLERYGQLGELIEHQVTLYNILGNIQIIVKGNHHAATEYYEKALSIAPSEGFLKANTLLNRGTCLRAWINIDQSRDDLTKALDLFERLPLSQRGGAWVACLTKLGGWYCRIGDSVEAFKWLEKAVQAHLQVFGNACTFLYTQILKWFEVASRSMGDLEKAIEYSIKALEANFNHFGERENIQRARIMRELAICLNKIDEYDLAIKCCLKAYALQKKIYPHNFFHPCLILNTMARSYTQKGEYKKALNYSKIIDQIKKEHLGNKHRKDIIFYLTKGDIFLGRKDTKKALFYISKGFEENKNSYRNQKDRRVCRFLISLGEVFNQMGDGEKGAGYYEQALEILQEIYPENHWFLYAPLEGLYKVWEKRDKSKAVYYEEWARRVKQNKPTLTQEQKDALIKMI